MPIKMAELAANQRFSVQNSNLFHQSLIDLELPI